VLAGLSGFYIVVRLDLWDRFHSLAIGGCTRWWQCGCCLH
jgi:hypothetical protein